MDSKNILDKLKKMARKNLENETMSDVLKTSEILADEMGYKGTDMNKETKEELSL